MGHCPQQDLSFNTFTNIVVRLAAVLSTIRPGSIELIFLQTFPLQSVCICHLSEVLHMPLPWTVLLLMTIAMFLVEYKSRINLLRCLCMYSVTSVVFSKGILGGPTTNAL
jgi:hypothetical protein